MFCKKCGNQLPEGAKFCAACGATTEMTQQTCSAAQDAPEQPAAAAARNTTQPQPVPPQPPAYTAAVQKSDAPLGVGQYIGMFLLMCVPILNIVLLFMWSFGKAVNINKRNFARASLVLAAIGLILWIVLGGAIMGAMSDMIGGYGYMY